MDPHQLMEDLLSQAEVDSLLGYNVERADLPVHERLRSELEEYIENLKSDIEVWHRQIRDAGLKIQTIQDVLQTLENLV